MSTNAIEIAGLVKRFGSTAALDGLTMAVPSGQIHGFLRPNGAGKSTTIRVLLGLLRADAGAARLLGATRGTTRRACTGASRTCPAT